MTTTLVRARPAGTKPTLEQILKAAPMLARAERTLEPLLLALGDGAASSVTVHSPTLTDGRRVAMTAELRDEILRRIDSGVLGYCEVDVPLLAYEQRTGVDNRNFVCFRDASMRAIGKTGEGKPFLRDHSQRDSMARGGTLVESGTEAPSEGHYEIRQIARLTEPWAIAMYLRGNMTTVSIGWIPTGPVLCSVCNAPVGEKCGGWWMHWPGDRLKEVVDEETGEKSYVASNKGSIVVRWIYTAAELIETSCVPVPGVPTAEMDQLRATLAASFVDGELSDARTPVLTRDSKSSPPQPAPSVESKMNDEPKLAGLRKALAAALSLPDEHRAHALTLDDEERETFLAASPADREVAVKAALAADPVVFTGELTKRIVRRSEGAAMLSMAKELEGYAVKTKAHEEQLAQQSAEREADEIKAICSKQLGSLPGSDDTHRFIVGALRKSGGQKEQIDAALKALAAASTNIAKQAKAPGLSDDSDPADDGPQAQFDRLVALHAKEHMVDERTARLAVVKTDEGRRLYAAIETSKKAGRA